MNRHLSEFNRTKLGIQNIEVKYKDTTSFSLKSGVVSIHDGTNNYVFKCNGIDKTVTGLSVSTQYFIYVNPPTSGNYITTNEVNYSSTVPTLNGAKQGYYHPTNTTWRCIGQLRTDASNNIVMFNIAGNQYSFFGDSLSGDINGSAPSNTQTTYTITAPLGNLVVSGMMSTIYVNVGFGVSWRKKGSNVTTGIPLLMAASNSPRQDGIVFFTIDSNKQVEMRWGGACTNTIYFTPYSYIIPSEILTSGSGGGAIETPMINTASRGLQSCSVEYKDTTSFYVNIGAVHIWDTTKESIYQIPSQITKTVTGLSVSTQYAIYAVPPSAGNSLTSTDISYSITMPTEDKTKMGWYHGTNTNQRCIGFIYSNGSSQILPFAVSRGEYSYQDFNFNELSSAKPSSTQTDRTVAGTPLGNVVVCLRMTATYSDTGCVASSRTKGSSGGGMDGIWVDSVAKQGTRNYKLLVDQYKRIEYRYSSATANNTVDMGSIGFIVPDGIYTGPAGGQTRNIIPTQNVVYTGHQQGMDVVYDTTSQFQVKAGSIHLNDGVSDQIYQLQSQTAKAVTGLSVSTWYAIYVKPPAMGTVLGATEIEYTSVMPIENQAKGGQYHISNTSWRCIGFIRSNSNSYITQFSFEDRFCFFPNKEGVARDLSSATPSNVWTTYTFSAPIGNLVIGIWLQLVYVNVADTIIKTKLPSSSDDGFPLSRSGSSSNAQRGIHVKFLIDSNKQAQIKYDSATTNQIFMDLIGFVLPNGIGSGGSGTIGQATTAPFDISKTGLKTGLKLEYKDATSFYINTGYLHCSDGAIDRICKLPAKTSVTIAGIAANKQYAVYIALPSTDSNVITTSQITVEDNATVLPLYYEDRLGQYQQTMGAAPNKRCIGFIRSDTTSRIIEFSIDQGFCYLTGPDSIMVVDLNGVTPSNTPTTYTLSAPIGSITVFGRLIGTYGSGNSDLLCRIKGLTTGIRMMNISVDNKRVDLVYAPVKVDANKQVEFQQSSACSSAITLTLTGYIFPDGM